MKKTDWSLYYSKPSKVAGLTRRVTERILIKQLKKYYDSRQTFKVQEMGGANSCFLDGITSEYKKIHYFIIDNCKTGLSLSKKRFGTMKRVTIKELDILKSNKFNKSEVVFSTGLIEHFNKTDTAIMIKKHFQAAKPSGLIIITYPTPTLMYNITRKFLEFIGLWKFHDERPLTRHEVEDTAKHYGVVKYHEVNKSIPLTQGVIVCVKNS